MDTVWKRNLVMLWFSQLLVMAGYDAMNPFVPLFMENSLGLTDAGRLTAYVSLYNISSFIGYGVANPLWGWMGDRYGMKSMLLRGTFLTALFWPMMAYVKTPETLAVLRFVTAFLAGTTAASQMMLARTVPMDRQGFAQGMLVSAIWSGSVLGNVAGGLLIHCFDYRVAFWGCGIMYFLAGVFILFTQDPAGREPVTAGDAPRRRSWLPELPKAVWILLLLFVVLGFIRRIDLPYTALQVEHLVAPGKAAFWTGIASSIIGIGAILSGVLLGRLLDRHPAKYLVLPIMGATALFYFPQAFCSVCGHGTLASFWVFTLTRALCFFAAGALQPMLQKLISRESPRDKRGLALGLATTGISVGGIGASAVGGLLMGRFGVSSVFLGTGILTILSMPLFHHYIGAISGKNPKAS